MADIGELSPELLLAQQYALGRIDKIEAVLKTHDPMVSIHCEEVLKVLKENEELVHILPDEKITVFMQGMQKYKMIELIKETATKRGKGKVTADDL
jgi:hypothetical protein